MYIKCQKKPGNKFVIKVFEKVSGKEHLIKHIGTAKDSAELDELRKLAHHTIDLVLAQRNYTLFKKPRLIDPTRLQLNSVRIVGLHQVLGKIYDEIGFFQVDNFIFKDLVLARIGFPGSKFKTSEYLASYFGIDIDVNKIYRFMNTFDAQHKDSVSQIAFSYITRTAQESLNIVFFDVTTLHYEAFTEDDFRKLGYSKVGKSNQPQIIIALVVSEEGIPIDYQMFEGSKFEGHTLIPLLERIKEKFKLKNLVVVADSAMLSKRNLDKLEQYGYQYIISAKIKNETSAIKQRILTTLSAACPLHEFVKGDLRLVVSYSPSRAVADARNREKAIKRMLKRIDLKKVSKSMIGNQNARKFLKLLGASLVEIDRGKVTEDERWDGLKGYLTNSSLTKEDVVSTYRNLWKVEKAFRMAKADLVVRPVYHYKLNRVKAHLCIVFVALVVSKVAELKLGLSIKRIVESLKLMRVVELTDSLSGSSFRYYDKLNIIQKRIYGKLKLKPFVDDF